MVLDNYGGQNIFFMMTEIGIFKKAENIYVVHKRKNACDRMFMLLKKQFHDKKCLL